jgi:hypothetical protein
VVIYNLYLKSWVGTIVHCISSLRAADVSKVCGPLRRRPHLQRLSIMFANVLRDCIDASEECGHVPLIQTTSSICSLSLAFSDLVCLTRPLKNVCCFQSPSWTVSFSTVGIAWKCTFSQEILNQHRGRLPKSISPRLLQPPSILRHCRQSIVSVRLCQFRRVKLTTLFASITSKGCSGAIRSLVLSSTGSRNGTDHLPASTKF